MTKDNKEVSELRTRWPDIENNVKELLLITNSNQIITLPKNMEKYVQAITCSADLSSGAKNVQIESRYIGFSLGKNIVKIRVNEKSNNISVEVE